MGTSSVACAAAAPLASSRAANANLARGVVMQSSNRRAERCGLAGAANKKPGDACAPRV
jgi:hypothetical protein